MSGISSPMHKVNFMCIKDNTQWNEQKYAIKGEFRYSKN